MRNKGLFHESGRLNDVCMSALAVNLIHQQAACNMNVPWDERLLQRCMAFEMVFASSLPKRSYWHLKCQSTCQTPPQIVLFLRLQLSHSVAVHCSRIHLAPVCTDGMPHTSTRQLHENTVLTCAARSTLILENVVRNTCSYFSFWTLSSHASR